MVIGMPDHAKDWRLHCDWCTYHSIVSPSPVSAFGLYFGPFHIGFGHRHRHRLAHHPHYVAPSPDQARRQNIAKATQADREALTETNTQAVQSCGGFAPGVTNLPIEEMRQTVHPTADQEAALDDLNAASSKANDIIKSSCPTAPPLTPVGRLSAAEQQLEAMIRAVQIVRSPLERLYNSLSDEQRRQFNAVGNSGKGEREPGSAPSGGDLTTLCDQQAGGGFRESAGAAHRADAAADYAAAKRARRSQEGVGRCR